MQSTSFKTFTEETGNSFEEFSVGDLIFIKNDIRHCISEVKSVQAEQPLYLYGWKWCTRAYSHHVVWNHPVRGGKILCTSLIMLGDTYINFGQVTIEEFMKEYPEYFI